MPEDLMDEKVTAEPTEEITSMEEIEEGEQLGDDDLDEDDFDDTEEDAESDEEPAQTEPTGDQTDAAEIDVATADPVAVLQLIMGGTKTKHGEKWVVEVSDEVVGRIHQLLGA